MESVSEHGGTEAPIPGEPALAALTAPAQVPAAPVAAPVASAAATRAPIGPATPTAPAASLDAAPSAENPTESGAEIMAPTANVPRLVPYRWKPGQSGNPSGRPRESGSLAAALRRVGVRPAKTRAELVKIAQKLGMDPEEARNIDVIAGLIYDGITQLLIRTVQGSTGAGDKLVGLLQLLFKALDGDERRITLNGPGELEAALTSVSAVLGFRAGAHALPQAGGVLPLPQASEVQELDDEPVES